MEGRETERAVGWLKQAANAGMIAAEYVICMILIFSGGEGDKKSGMSGLSVILKDHREEARKARLQLTHIILRRLLPNIPIHNLHQIPVCCTITGHDIISGRNLTFLLRPTADDDEDNAVVECSFCRCDLEISFINKMLSFVGIVKRIGSRYVITD